MRWLILVFLFGLAWCEQPISYNYHARFGIEAAARLAAAERAADFDGSRIVGGNLAMVGTNPHFAGIAIILTNGLSSMCGATLLTNNRAVTAAMCWNDGRSQAFSFTLIFESLLWMAGGIRFFTREVEMHPDFNPGNANNNIAMVRFGGINFNQNIRPAILPSGSFLNNNFVGNWANACGFGRISDVDHGLGTNQFQYQVQLQVISNEECERSYGPSVVRPSTLCTSGAARRNICHGDFGGPLDIIVNSERLLIGISSFVAQSGCESGYPGGFTRVTSYVDWIRSKL